MDHIAEIEVSLDVEYVICNTKMFVIGIIYLYVYAR